jgi:RNA recognition motif-containing protein
VDAQIIRDHISNKSRGFGYVTFHDENTVDHVVEIPHRICDKDVSIFILFFSFLASHSGELGGFFFVVVVEASRYFFGD